MALLDKLLPKLQADGHRVLIFSQFRVMLDIIEDYMALRGFSYERVDGAVAGKKRQAAIDRYSAPVISSSNNVVNSTTSATTDLTAGGCVESSGGNTTAATTNATTTTSYTTNEPIFAMLLSTRAGGVGINLTAADTVIIFDSDWNPQNDLQAQARAHRIGQTKCVKVYRLLCRKSYEMVMFKAASLKLGLDYAVMHNMNTTSSAQDHLRNLRGQTTTSSTDTNNTDSPTDNNNDMETENIDTAVTTTKRGSGRRSNKNKNEIEGISLERTEHMSSLSKRDLENLLKHGAYDIFREEKDGTTTSESTQFYEADIDQILQRSAVVLHDERGNTSLSKSAATGAGASFAKASFVSSLSSNNSNTTGSNTNNNIALDDPDFWTKVVGLASKEEEGGNNYPKKRKCNKDSISYKELGLNQFKINNPDNNPDNNNNTDDDSDDEDNNNNSNKKRKNNKNKFDESQPVEYTDENMQKLLTSVLSRGYGNWETIRTDTKLYWHVHDICRGCRLAILQVLKAACSIVSKQQINATTATTATNNDNNDDVDTRMQITSSDPTTTATVTNTNATVILDMKYLENFLRRSRVCNLSLAALAQEPAIDTYITKSNHTNRSTSTTAANSTTTAMSTEENDNKLTCTLVEDDIIDQCLKNITHLITTTTTTTTATATINNDDPTTTASDNGNNNTLLTSFYESYDVYCIKNVIGTSTDETTTPINNNGDISTNNTQVVDKVIQLLNSLTQLSANATTTDSTTTNSYFAEISSENIIKTRNAARLKLTQLEDMFEICLAAKVMHLTQLTSSVPVQLSETEEVVDRKEEIKTPTKDANTITTTATSAVANSIHGMLIETPRQATLEANTNSATSTSTNNSPTTNVASSTNNANMTSIYATSYDQLLKDVHTPDWNDNINNILFITAVNQVGWPEGKRKMNQINEILELSEKNLNMNTTTENNNNDDKMNTENIITTTSTDVNNDNDAMILSTTESTSPSTKQHHHQQQQTVTTATAATTAITDSKIFLKRMKHISQVFKEIGRKPIPIEEKPEKIKPEKVKIIDTETLIQKENKKFVSCLLKSLFRLGRPRSMYEPLRMELTAKIDAIELVNQQTRQAHEASTSATTAAAVVVDLETSKEEGKEVVVTQSTSSIKPVTSTSTTTKDNHIIEYFDARKYLLTWDTFIADVASNLHEIGYVFDATNASDIIKVQDAVTTLFLLGDEILNTPPAPAVTATSAAAVVTPTPAAAVTTGGSADEGSADVAKITPSTEEPVDLTTAADDKDNIGTITKTKIDTKTIKNGLFMKTSYRTIENCLERCHLLHQTRIALTHHCMDNFFQLRAAIRRECKGAGPSCPKPRRDQNLPVWWTVHHDVALLKEILDVISINNSTSTTTNKVSTDGMVVDIDSPPITVNANSTEDESTDMPAGTTDENKKDKDNTSNDGFNWKLITSNDNIFKAASNFTMPHKVHGMTFLFIYFLFIFYILFIYLIIAIFTRSTILKLYDYYY